MLRGNLHSCIIAYTNIQKQNNMSNKKISSADQAQMVERTKSVSQKRNPWEDEKNYLKADQLETLAYPTALRKCIEIIEA